MRLKVIVLGGFCSLVALSAADACYVSELFTLSAMFTLAAVAIPIAVVVTLLNGWRDGEQANTN